MLSKDCTLNQNYLVYSDGRIQNKTTNTFIKPNLSNGYLSCTIGGKPVRIHRLVALAFLPNPDNLPIVNHIDHNKHNNHVSNLEWVTSVQNTKESLKINGPNVKRCVIQLNIDGSFVKEFQSIADASRETGSSCDMITKCASGAKYCQHVFASDGKRYGWSYKQCIAREELPVDGKKITGFENYLVTDQGQVYSTFARRYIKLSKNKDGYVRVNLMNKTGEKKWFSVHRLVAEYFIGPPLDGKTQVNHINFVRDNNFVDNLEWVTPKENNIHSAHRKGKIVGLKNISTGQDIFFRTCSEAARYLGVGAAHVANCCRGLKKSAKNHECRYLEEHESLGGIVFCIPVDSIDRTSDSLVVSSTPVDPIPCTQQTDDIVLEM